MTADQEHEGALHAQSDEFSKEILAQRFATVTRYLHKKFGFDEANTIIGDHSRISLVSAYFHQAQEAAKDHNPKLDELETQITNAQSRRGIAPSTHQSGGSLLDILGSKEDIDRAREGARAALLAEGPKDPHERGTDNSASIGRGQPNREKGDTHSSHRQIGSGSNEG